MAEKTILLIDGNSLLYRSFYAIKHLSNSKGFPTNAIFGFLSSMRKFMDQHNPDSMGVVFDTKGPTFRHLAFKEYKAHRKPMPDDLVIQIPMLRKILKALNIPILEKKKYEADDVLGSLSRIVPSYNLHSIIVTTDKDLLQLVDKNTSVYNNSKDLLLNEDGVEEMFGVPPSKIIDVLALWGDASDNIPGVPGIGEKTSKMLINQFGCIDELLENLGRVEKIGLREKITENLAQLQLSRELVTIEINLDIPFDPEDFILKKPNYGALIPLLQEMEFSSLLSEYVTKSDQKDKDYVIIWEETQLKELVDKIKRAKRVA